MLRSMTRERQIASLQEEDPMQAAAPSPSPAAVPSIGIGALLAGIDGGEGLFLLDVRNDIDFAAWRVEGLRPVETLNLPYFAFLEEPEESIARVPRGRDVVVLCAKGDSSELVAGMLRERGIPARNVAGGMVAYGDHLEAVRVPLGADAAGLEIWQVSRRGKGCLSYVVRAGGEAVVVDPSRRAGWYRSFVAELGARIVRVLDTHVHADHVSGGPALAEEAGAAYFVDAGDGFDLRLPVGALPDGEALRLGAGGGIDVRALRTPGHTPGSTSYLVAGRWLLSGDTLFIAGVGRPDLGGHVEEWGRELFASLRSRLAALPDETVVLPGHFGGASDMGPAGLVSSRLGDLRRDVPEMRLASPEEFVAVVRSAVKPPPEAYRHIVRVNLGAERASDAEIAEWELGKNECSAAAKTA
jgi:glyoxylase-like metal-dependent hydrolase (beta-lactamase superfamily II)/rhodanese-related sulfurtransferase